MAAPAVTRTPNLHRANESLLESANGSMATVATRREEKNPVQRKNKRTDLTPTGLLMEGHFAQNPYRGILSAIEIFSPITRTGNNNNFAAPVWDAKASEGNFQTFPTTVSKLVRNVPLVNSLEVSPFWMNVIPLCCVLERSPAF